MKKPIVERDILGRRGAAAAAVFFVSGPICFIFWMRISADGVGPHWSWHVPAATIAALTLIAYLLPEKTVDFAAHLIGALFVGWE